MPLFLDCETHLIAPGRQVPPVVSVCMADTTVSEPQLLLAHCPMTLGRVQTALDTADIVVGHNVAYDLACLVEHWPQLWPTVERLYKEHCVDDTMILGRLRDIGKTGRLERSYSLDTLSQRTLGRAPLDKAEDGWRLRYAELAQTAIEHWPERARRYALDDVVATRDLWRDLGRQPTSRAQAQAAWGLHLTSARGVRTDAARVAALDAALQRTIDQQGAIARCAGFLRSDGSKDRKAGLAAVGGDSLTRQDMRDSDNPGLVALADVDEARKIQSTYLPWLREAAAGPVHPRYTVLVESGRTSSWSPNIQQLPRSGGVRECLTPRPGYCFVVADLSVAEMVCLAQVLLSLYGSSKMADALRRGLDLHLLTASSILHRSYEDTVAAFVAGDEKVKKTRQLAKGVNFGAAGGLGSARLAEMLDVKEAEATKLKQAWVATYPELQTYFGDLSAITRGGGYRLVHPLTGYVRAGLDFTSAANHYFQHLCSAGAKQALYLVAAACYSGDGPLSGCHPWAFVHDEIVLEVPIGQQTEAAAELERLMVDGFATACPDVPVKVEALATMQWVKGAKRVMDGDRLAVWGI